MATIERYYTEIWSRRMGVKHGDQLMRWFLNKVSAESSGKARAGNFRMERRLGRQTEHGFVFDDSGDDELWSAVWVEQAES